MKPFPLTIALLLLAGGGCTTSSAARRDIAVAAELGSKFDTLRQEAHIPGLAVVMMRGDTIVLARGFGLADVERGIAVTPDTPFNIASVTKPISAVVALRLVQDGKLSLDTPMQQFAHFAEFCAEAQSEGGIFFGDVACADERLTLRRVLSMTANGEPGSRFLYNPPLYSWASRPMAEVGGEPFSSLVQRLVFEPAGMPDSARIHRKLPLREDLASRLAIPYHVDESGAVVRSEPPPPQGDGAAGGVISTALDLAHFDMALEAGNLLSAASRAELWRGTPSGTNTFPYGIGWFLGTYKGRPVAWHTGVWDGQYSALYLKILGDSARERATLILLANSDGLRWQARLDEAAIERSPFAAAFLDAF